VFGVRVLLVSPEAKKMEYREIWNKKREPFEITMRYNRSSRRAFFRRRWSPTLNGLALG